MEKGQACVAPKLAGTYFKFVLEKPPVNFLAPDPEQAANSSKLPYVLMHMPKTGGQTRVVVSEPTTAVDTATTPVDASPEGTLGAADETSFDGGTGAGECEGGARDSALARLALGLDDICAHCGKEGVELKRCSRCKQVSYCGAECQKAGWKQHKETCEPPLSRDEVWANVLEAVAALDWLGVLKWEGRMEELLATLLDADCNQILMHFTAAHEMCSMTNALHERISTDHALSVVRLLERRVELLGTMQLLRDQGGAMCDIGDLLRSRGKKMEAARWHQRARDLGAAHGFFSVESKACQGLGQLALEEGRDDEGRALLRNAVTAASLAEGDSIAEEMQVLPFFIRALFESDAIDEVEPLVRRFRELGKECSRKCDAFATVHLDLNNLYYCARLHEVPCSCTLCWEPLHNALHLHSGVHSERSCTRPRRSSRFSIQCGVRRSSSGWWPSSWPS